MNKNIECLIEACKEKKVYYKIHNKSNNLVEIVINGISYLFVNWTTPLNKHSIAYLQQDKDYFFNFFKNKIKMPETKSYLNPHCDERYSQYLEKNTIFDIIIDIENHFNYPFIIKKNRGSWGTNVFKVNNRVELEKSLFTVFNESSNSYDYIVLAQEFIDIQTEYRAIFYNGKLQFCYEKDITNATFTNNLSPFHQDGAKAVLITDKNLLDRINNFSKVIFQNLPIAYTGLDIAIDNKDELWLIEANSSPGFDNIIKSGNKKVVIDLYITILNDLETINSK